MPGSRGGAARKVQFMILRTSAHHDNFFTLRRTQAMGALNCQIKNPSSQLNGDRIIWFAMG